MQAINNIRLDSLVDTLVSLSAAFILGGLIGFERQYRQRTAGLRTNVLVARISTSTLVVQAFWSPSTTE